MRTALRWLGAMMAVALIVSAALLGMCWFVTTGTFMGEVLGNTVDAAQERIKGEVLGISAEWYVSEATLSPWVENAAAGYAETVAEWWAALWQDASADAALPMFLDGSAERDMVAAIMADEAFVAATAADTLRSVARDDVAYAIDEAICEAVLPLRRSVVDVGLAMAAEQVDFPTLHKHAWLWAITLAAFAGIFIALLYKEAGCILVSAGGTMALCAVPVAWLGLDVLLAALNPLAAAQWQAGLALLGTIWGVLAAALCIVGLIIIAVRNRRT